ncbi:Transthyretin-like protein 46 [Caenorhabditis elegans]|uniref:Transthyretin-like protein 46 n=1 Tax=Caenorhabditis elegans TaxID=6239 RepID=TTR46_CAEEL|nr:Transthyretin-like protein 46 [Caenorhabditis elegans]Q22285.1 RecName: Full=Transthyretin-like protein 46; Flags: Precursor [Caenorhabditis elegans]CAA98286.1 Transthyretin-like protein 46 [Caenorhabditis elegans]|eukprot:NP_505561.1 Transthyretin-like protein 46 [Caenorhabditis elegans]
MNKLFVLLIALLGLTAAMRDQSIAVKGRLLCGNGPAANVRVKLWEEDTGPDPDDLLDQGYTDANGEFSLQGGTAELTPIDPVFKVYHKCDDSKLKPGARKVKLALPKSYITSGKVAKKTFDIGVLNLETVFAKEERELLVSRRRRGGFNADYMDPDNSEKDQSKSSEESEDKEKTVETF